MPTTFTDSEWCFLFDVFKTPWVPEGPGVLGMDDEVAHAVRFDRLDRKWGIDGQRVLNRMKRMSYVERLAVVEMSEAFWNLGVDQSYDQVICRIKEGFRPTQTSKTPARSSRMNRDLLPSLAGQDTHDSEPSDRWVHDDEDQPLSPGKSAETYWKATPMTAPTIPPARSNSHLESRPLPQIQKKQTVHTRRPRHPRGCLVSLQPPPRRESPEGRESDNRGSSASSDSPASSKRTPGQP